MENLGAFEAGCFTEANPLREKTMNKKKMAGVMIASLSMPLLLTAIGLPVANADTSVTSTVETIDNCKWAFGNAPSEIVMTSKNGALYRGDALLVSTDFDAPTLGLSGTVETALLGESVDCSFYNKIIPAKIMVELGEILEFTAKIGEVVQADMTFSIGGTDDSTDTSVTNTMKLVPDLDSCTGGNWVSNESLFTEVGGKELLQHSNTDNGYGTGVAPRCAAVSELSISIPGRKTAPNGAGSEYTFSGPILTFTPNYDEN